MPVSRRKIRESFDADDDLVDFEVLDEGAYLNNVGVSGLLPGEKISEDPRTDLY